MTRLRMILEFTALILTIAVCAAMLVVITRGLRIGPSAPQAARAAGQRPDDAIPVEPASLGGAQIEGDRAAKIAVIEYSDFQCPYCGRFANETFPEFEKQYVRSGKVLFAFRQFPLEAIHPYALKAAEATECAADQGKFWALHTLTFADQAHLDDTAVFERAAKTGLDVQRFGKCLQGDVASRVRADEQTGQRMLVSGAAELGARARTAWRDIYDGHKSLWALSHCGVVDSRLDKQYFVKHGLLSLEHRYRDMHCVIAPAQLMLALD